MKSKLAILIGIVVFLISCNTSVKLTSLDLNKDEERIREVLNEVSQYGRKGDWENFKKYFVQTEKLQIINSEMGLVLNGWEEFSAYYKVMMDLIFKEVENNIKITFSDKSELVNVNISKSRDMAWATEKSFLSPLNSDKKNHIWSVTVLEKIEGEWKVVMNSSSMMRQLAGH